MINPIPSAIPITLFTIWPRILGTPISKSITKPRPATRKSKTRNTNNPISDEKNMELNMELNELIIAVEGLISLGLLDVAD